MTGVQTCALPISDWGINSAERWELGGSWAVRACEWDSESGVGAGQVELTESVHPAWSTNLVTFLRAQNSKKENVN